MRYTICILRSEWKLLSHVWLCNPHGLLSPWNSPGQNTGVGDLSLLQRIFPNPGIEPRSPALQADSLLAEQLGKPKNTGVSSVSLFQRIFPTQELNWGLRHCRPILYQLSYQEIFRTGWQKFWGAWGKMEGEVIKCNRQTEWAGNRTPHPRSLLTFFH